MDHKVSKDMISSGMIPSGEKTQADLGRTQYGSAPSPSKLMDAYKSMYDKKEEVINEMAGKGMGMTPAPKPGGITPRKQTPETTAADRPKPVEKDSSSPTPKTDSYKDQVMKKGFSKSYDKVGPKTETDDMLDKVRDRRVEKAVNRSKDVRRATAKRIMTQYGENIDLLAAYRAVYEHHKKDADGNTIPHEDEEVNEGKIPAGLQAYLDKKKGKKEDKKEVKEETDLFDVISTHFINEGYEEKDVYKAMASLTEDQLQNLDEALPAIGAALAALPAIAGKLATGAAVAGKTAVAAGTKGLMAATKGIAAGSKAAMKGVVSAAKPVAQSVSKGVSKATTGVKDLVGKGTTQIKKVVNPQPANKQLSLDLGKAGKSSPTGSSNTGQNKVVDFLKREGEMKLRQELTKDRDVKGTNKTAMAYAQKTNVAASTDLFDIVKGQLLDEGLSEEEIKDIMLTLTPDEILKEMEDKPMEVNVADAKANTPAYQNYMKGMKSKVTGKPMYTASQDMKDRARGLK